MSQNVRRPAILLRAFVLLSYKRLSANMLNVKGEVSINIFIGYVFLGLSLSAPIGPINAAQLDKGIRGGFWHAYGW